MLVIGIVIAATVAGTIVWILLILRGGNDGSTTTVAAPTPTTAPSPVVTPSASTVTIPEGWQSCVNDALGYSIAYPGGWYTTDMVTLPNGVIAQKPKVACSFFNPRRFQILWGTEPPTTALMVESQDRSMNRIAALMSDPRYLSVVSQEDTTAAGMPAVQLEVTQTGEGYYPKGTLEYMYVIEVAPGRSLVVSTMFFPDSPVDYPAYKDIVDMAAQTVQPA